MELLKKLPGISDKSKQDMLDMLLKEEYGYFPNIDISVQVSLDKVENKNFAAGKAVFERLLFSCKSEKGEFTFPVSFIYPKKKKRNPCFVHINFGAEIPHRLQPTEEIIDNGYAVLSFCYKDVSSDDGDFTNGIASLIYDGGERGDYDCGKIGIWAWAAMRVMDYAQTREELDPERVSVAGHSRLGKTALLAGALDERFYCAISNDSGCSGAALARETEGEDIAAICRVFPFWFCKNYYKYANNEESMPFDQHFLVAANYPHKVYVASAEEDQWAYPKNEYLSCVAASEFFETHGMMGFVGDDALPVKDKYYNGGSIGYHLRGGTHYMSREDWQRYFEFLGE
ncbi:MAG: hypothetical protein J6L85_03335 [Clostridia bacterium]|nr:hypothetical protein [Clostridia bacterium]